MRLALDEVAYTWPTGSTIGPMSLRVAAGERVLVTGRSGCGKSTLLRLAAGLADRHGGGVVSGRITVEGADPSPATVGFVGQEPGDQLLTGTVADELAFGPESAGWAPERVRERIVELLRRVGLEVAPDRDPRRLSGGQQQRLVVGAALAVGAGLLLLDEPLAQLDPDGARALLDQLARLADEGVAVVLVEHRLEPCLPWAGRVVILDGGRIVRDVPREALDPVDLAGRGLRAPFTPPPTPRARIRRPEGDVVASVVGLTWSWGDVPALDGVTIEVRAGEHVALLGPNGAGKSTLLAALAGRIGRSDHEGRVVEVPQDPDLSLFCATVADELAYGPRELGLPVAIEPLASAFSLADLLDRPPHALSRGQRLRVAVAAALACRPDLLLLDEPTAGQDQASVDGMLDALDATHDRALVYATHDVELALRRATRIVLLRRGRIAYDGPPAALIASDLLPLPPVARWCREQGLDWDEVR